MKEKSHRTLHHIASESGTIELRLEDSYLPSSASSTWIVVVLRHLESDAVPALLAGAYRNDVLRIPFAPQAGRQQLHVPAGRSLSIMLVCRDSTGKVLTSPPLTLHEMNESVPSHVQKEEDAEDAPALVFVEGGPHPDLKSLALGVAEAIKGRQTQSPKPHHQGSFGTKQRWYLSRIKWTPTPGPLRLIARSTFIHVQDVEAWQHAPPDDAIPIDPGCDSLIDATTEDGKVTFYAVLEQRETWSPLVLSPVLPPFETVSKPFVLGDPEPRLADAFTKAQQRLSTEAVAATDLSGLLDLWEAAVQHLSPSAFRTEVLNWVRATRDGVLF